MTASPWPHQRHPRSVEVAGAGRSVAWLQALQGGLRGLMPGSTEAVIAA